MLCVCLRHLAPVGHVEMPQVPAVVVGLPGTKAAKAGPERMLPDGMPDERWAGPVGEKPS